MEIKILKGGLDPSNPNRYKFIYGRVTNTRLMGVVAMHLAYQDTLLVGAPDFHQFYYFDYEELGLEHMNLVHSSDPKFVEVEETIAFAGLGADIVEITEDEGALFAYWMAMDTKKKQEELPEELPGVQFVLDKGKAIYEAVIAGAAAHVSDAASKAAAHVAEAEGKTADATVKTAGAAQPASLEGSTVWQSLNQKMCVPINSDYGVINYFLMRVFGLDFEAAAFVSTLKTEEIKKELNYTHCTFLRNKIESKDGVGTHRYYTCETLVDVEKENRHHVILSEIEVKDRKVVGLHKISDTSISEYEAGLILAKTEFTSVFDFKGDLAEDGVGEIYIDILTNMTVGMTHNEHPSGTMFMCFKDNNKHAENKVFMLNDDLKYLLFVTLSGQIVISSFSVDGIMEGERKIVSAGLADSLELAGRFNFPTSIIYDFAESGLDDFIEFLKALN